VGRNTDVAFRRMGGRPESVKLESGRCVQANGHHVKHQIPNSDRQTRLRRGILWSPLSDVMPTALEATVSAIRAPRAPIGFGWPVVV
jgi:hypothetical protein